MDRQRMIEQVDLMRLEEARREKERRHRLIRWLARWIARLFSHLLHTSAK